MSIRFKFRSAVSFDTADIEGRPSISVRDLRSKIIRQKNLNVAQDMDLVFSDDLNGRAYEDENFQIPSGSSVIIKRVPARTVPSALPPIDTAENFVMKDSNLLKPLALGGQMDDFDDFGIDLCPTPEAAFPYSDLEIEKNCTNNEKATIARLRLGGQKLEANDLSEGIPRGSNQGKTEANVLQKQKVEEHTMLENQRAADAISRAMQNVDFPSELKCSLCTTYFKEAVMIPCCQHSFCDKCIRVVLIEKARCPKCYSSKCRVEDLLPNLSLRQAIVHFLESQMLIAGSDNDLHKYVPDGESGIQVKDVSCAMTIGQREPDLPHSPSTTGKGSNQIMTESVYESLNRKNTSLGGSGYQMSNLGAGKTLKSAPVSHKVKQIDEERDGYAHHVDFGNKREVLGAVADFQGENQPLNLPQSGMHDEVDSTVKKRRGLWLDTTGGDRSFTGAGRNKKGDRTCYMCGSPDHFMRDCPRASNPHPMLHTGNAMFPGVMPGYASPYWNNTAMPPLRPFTNVYGNLGMMPFNAPMVPVPPFAVPPYSPSIYGSLPRPGGFMRMGDMAPPVGNKVERPFTNSEFLDLRECENRRLAHEHMGRGQFCDDEDDFRKHYHHNELGRSYSYKSRTEKEKSASYSGDSFTRKSRGKHQEDVYFDHGIQSVDDKHEKSSRPLNAGKDQRQYQSERSISGVDNRPKSSDRHTEERHKHHHRNSEEHHERRGQCGSDSSWGRHQTKKDDVKKRGGESNDKGSQPKRNSYSESARAPSSSGEKKQQYKEKYSRRDSRHSRQSLKPVSGEMCNDRWHMFSGSDEDCREGHNSHKRKRLH